MSLTQEQLDSIARIPPVQLTLNSITSKGITLPLLAGAAADGQLSSMMSPELADLLNLPMMQTLIMVATLERVGRQYSVMTEMLKELTEAVQALRVDMAKRR